MIGHCVNFAEMNDLQHSYFNHLDKFRKFLLNAGSHDDYDTPMFKSEINDCIKIFENYFNKIKLKHILPASTVLVFELVDSKKSETYKFEITLLENLRIYKEPSREICILRVRTRYLMFKDGELKATDNKQISLKQFYEKHYSTSDGKKDENFLKVVFVKEDSRLLDEIVKF